MNNQRISPNNTSCQPVNRTDWFHSNSMPQDSATVDNGLPHKPTISNLNHESPTEDHYSGDGMNNFLKTGQPDRQTTHATGFQDYTTAFPPPVQSNRDGGLLPSPPSDPQNHNHNFARSLQENSEVPHPQFNHPYPVDTIRPKSGTMPTTNCMPSASPRMNHFTQPYAGQLATVLQQPDESQPQFSYNQQNQFVRPVSPALYSGTAGMMASPAHRATPPVPTNPSGFPPSAYQQPQQQPHYQQHQQHVPQSNFPPTTSNTFSPVSTFQPPPNKPVYPPAPPKQTQPGCYQSTIPPTAGMYPGYHAPTETNVAAPQSFGYSQQQVQQPPQPGLSSLQPAASAMTRTPHDSGGSRVPPNAPLSGSRPVSQNSSSPAYEGYASQSSSPQNRYPTLSSLSVPSTPLNTTSGSFRSPGASSSRAEWDSVKSPIGLLHERNILPSDGADLPPRPVVNLSVNCDPDIMRCTLNNIPSTSTLLSTCRLPLGLVMHPFRDIANPCIVNSPVIVRCRSCRTYINPFVQFIQSGSRWRCTVCSTVNSVPDAFRYEMTVGNLAQLSELRSATVEFIAPSEYMLRPPQPATYLFCFDVSRNAIATGYLHFVCREIAAALAKIPGDARRRIAFLSYNSTVHFYQMFGDSMKMLICPDVSEPFIPDSEGLINPIEDTMDVLQDFLHHLPDSFIDTDDVGNCLGVALQIGLKMIGSSGGRITVFNTCLPTVGVGSLQLREQVADMNAPEPKHMAPAIDFYKTLALDCASQQVAVDMFVLNSQYCDIATLSGICRFSSGCLYHYPEFLYHPTTHSGGHKGVTSTHDDESGEGRAHVATGDPHRDELKVNGVIEVERLHRDLARYLRRNIGLEAVMRIRCTQGLSIQSFHGSFFVRSTDLMSLPNVSPDAGFAVQLGVSDDIQKCNTVCMQAAILYTSSEGDRRIRVHTLCLPVVHTANEVFVGADPAAITCLIGKMAVDRTISAGLANARDGLINAVVDSMSAYASSSTGMTPAVSSTNYGIACPPNLRLLPLYVCGLLRYRAFAVSGVRLDDRSAAFERLKSAPLDEMLPLFYPRLYAVHNLVAKPMAPMDATLAQTAATALSLADHGDARPTSVRGRDYKVSGANEVDHDSASSSSENDIENLGDEVYSAANLPGQLHLSTQSINTKGVYLLDTGEMLLLLVGTGDNGRLYPSTPSASSGSRPADRFTTLKQLLGVDSPTELPVHCGPFALPPFNPAGEPETDVPIARRRLCALIGLLRYRRPTNSALVWMRHDAASCLRSRFMSAFVEDRTKCSPSYQEFLERIQKTMQG